MFFDLVAAAAAELLLLLHLVHGRRCYNLAIFLILLRFLVGATKIRHLSGLKELVKQLMLDGVLVVSDVWQDVLVSDVVQARDGVQVARVLRVVPQERHRLGLGTGCDVRTVPVVDQDLVVRVRLSLDLFRRQILVVGGRLGGFLHHVVGCVVGGGRVGVVVPAVTMGE